MSLQTVRATNECKTRDGNSDKIRSNRCLASMYLEKEFDPRFKKIRIDVDEGSSSEGLIPLKLCWVSIELIEGEINRDLN